MSDPSCADLVHRRHAIYAVTSAGPGLPADAARMISAIREAGITVTVVHGSLTERAELDNLADRLVDAPTDDFSPLWYVAALASIELADDDELVLTGDGVLGPIGPMDVLDVGGGTWDAWSLVENRNGSRESFAMQGFPALAKPWMWTSFRGTLVRSGIVIDYLDAATAGDVASAEFRAMTVMAAHGWRVGYVFPAAEFPSNDPALLNAVLLLDAGCPFVDKAVFRSYPPFLDRMATVGREIVEQITERGYPSKTLWDGLVRTTPPKALNTNAGMLEVLDGHATQHDLSRPMSIAVIARVTWLDGLGELLRRVDHLPGPVDL